MLIVKTEGKMEMRCKEIENGLQDWEMETTKILKFKWIIGREDMRRICNEGFLDKTHFG